VPPVVTAIGGPGVGEGWTRLAEALRGVLPVTEIDGIWVFRTLRRESKDFGTAIVSRVEGDRRRIYTARYNLAVKGKTRGRFEFELLEVGSGPLTALEQLLALVPKRAEDEEPPTRIPVETWFAAEEPAPDAG
jgi:hypothetical protein